MLHKHGRVRCYALTLRIFAMAVVMKKAVIALSVLAVACSPVPKQELAVQEAGYAKGYVGKRPSEGDFWAHRVSYPTGQFSPKWVVDASKEDALVSRGIPGGEPLQTRSPSALDPTRFTLLGPMPLVFGGYGNVGGRVNVVLVDPRQNPNSTWTVFAASDGGGVWKTSNCCSSETTWQVKTDFPQIASTAIGEMSFDPNNPDVIYAGTGDLRYGSFSFGSSGILKSTDRGETWAILGENVFNPSFSPLSGNFPQYDAVGKVRVDPQNSQTVVAGTKRGLFFSRDGGSNWAGPCLTNGFSGQRQDITGLEISVRSGVSTIYAAVGVRGNPTPVQPDLGLTGANGLYRAAMNASGCPAAGAWSLISRPDNGFPSGTGQGSGNPLGRIEIALAPSNNSIIYVKSADPASSGVLGTWRSSDGGDTFSATATGAGFGGCAGAGNQMWYDAGLTVHPDDPNVVMASTVDLHRSTNGGASFINQTCGYNGGNVHVDHHGRAFIGGGDPLNPTQQMLVGTDGGVYYTADALNSVRPTWISLNRDFPTIEFYSGDISANFATATVRSASGGAQDNGSSVSTWTDGPPVAQPWTVRLGGDGIVTRIEPVNNLRYYYSSQWGNLSAAVGGPNSGASTNVRPPSPYVGGSAGTGIDTKSFLTPFEIYKHGGTNAGEPCGPPNGCGRMILGTRRVWETLSGGIPAASWVPNSPDLTKGTLVGRSFINQLAYAISTPSVAIAGTNDGNVWMGFNMGAGSANSATWVNLTNGNAVLPDRPIMDVVIDGQNPLVGYAAVGGFDQNTPRQPGRVFMVSCASSCTSFTWANKSGNLPNIPINAIMVNPRLPGQVFAGSDWGLYYTDNINQAQPVWQKFSNGMPSAMVWDMQIDRGVSTLAVYTRSRGAYVWPLPSASDLIFANSFE